MEQCVRRIRLASDTTGNGNSAVGVSALNKNTSGLDNSALGVNALLNNTTGQQISAFGSVALRSNTIGFNNSAFGDSAPPGTTRQATEISLSGKAAGAALTIGDQQHRASAIRVWRAKAITTRIVTRISPAAFIAGIAGNDLSATGTAVVVTPSGQLGTGAFLAGPAGPAGPQGLAGVAGRGWCTGCRGCKWGGRCDRAAGPAPLRATMGPRALPRVNGLNGATGSTRNSGAPAGRCCGCGWVATGPQGLVRCADRCQPQYAKAEPVRWRGQYDRCQANTASGRIRPCRTTSTGSNNSAVGASGVAGNTTGWVEQCLRCFGALTGTRPEAAMMRLDTGL